MQALDALEAESIYILREAKAEFQNPALLYSVGKDSSVLAHLIRKAFAPGPIPFTFFHVDTGFKFQEMYRFRDAFVKEIGAELIVYKSGSGHESSTNPYDLGLQRCCGLLKTQALLQMLGKYGIDAAIGGARREEEKSRAKERIFSVRDPEGQWDPKRQRPEPWTLYNTRLNSGETMRIFPLSNWTELDIWHYIQNEAIPVVSYYFAEPRPVIVRNGGLLPAEGRLGRDLGPVETIMCRFRTLGCSPCTGAVRSTARTPAEIIEELQASRDSERVTRFIDHDVGFSMERKKQEGYF